MSCPTIASGDAFLGSTLTYLDCAGQQLGETGYQAMSAPGSVVGQVLLACLTLFIAIQGFRLMFGQRLDLGGATVAAVKIGLVLMLAGSWPAVRVLFHDTLVKGPSELVVQIGGNPASMATQLQSVDSGIVALTKWGTGKLDIRAGRTADGSPAGSEFAGEAADESTAFSGGRLFFLVSAIGAVGLPRLMGGLLVSILPLVAGLLLFDRARSIAIGWARAWLFLFLAGFAGSILLAIEAAMLQPWLARVIEERSANLATPSAPIELMAMTGAFAVMIVGSLALLARVCFSADVVTPVQAAWSRGQQLLNNHAQEPVTHRPQPAVANIEQSRVQQIGASMAAADRRATLSGRAEPLSGGWGSRDSQSGTVGTGTGRAPDRMKRATQRLSRSSRKRDLK